jgi:hypothetical protein
MRDKFLNNISSFLFSIRSKLLSTSFGSIECTHNALKFIDSLLCNYPTESIHVQVFVDEVNAFVDSRVAMTVKYLNRIGIKTSSSCEDVHDDEWGSVVWLNILPAMKEKFVDLLEQMAGLEYKYSTEEGTALFYFTELNHLKLLRIILDTYINQTGGDNHESLETNKPSAINGTEKSHPQSQQGREKCPD